MNWAGVAVPLWIAASGPTARPAPTEDQVELAEQTVTRAVALRDAGKLEEASAALAEAYALNPDRDYLFMRGVIERERGLCSVAVPLFESFIAERPSVPDIKAAEREVALCPPQPAVVPLVQEAPVEPADKKVEPVGPPPPPPDLTLAPGARPPAGETDQPRGTVGSDGRLRPWWRDPAGGVLAGVGLALGGTGGILLGLARARGGTANQAPTAGEYRERRGQARRLGVSGLTVLGVGGAALIGGVVRYAIVARRAKRRAVD